MDTTQQPKTANPPYYNKTAMYNNRDILYRMTKGAAITPEERAAFIAAHPEAFVSYMIANNLNSVNNVLRHEKGFGMLPYNADKKQIEGQLEMLFDKNHTSVLQDVINGFVFNPNANNWTTDPQLVSELKSHRVL